MRRYLEQGRKVLLALRRGQRGISRLEYAIVILAFLVIAAVFGYAVARKGFLGPE